MKLRIVKKKYFDGSNFFIIQVSKFWGLYWVNHHWADRYTTLESAEIEVQQIIASYLAATQESSTVVKTYET